MASDLEPDLPPARRRLLMLLLAWVGLVACWIGSLSSWLRIALREDIHSHVLVVPCVSLYLAWHHREWQTRLGEGSPGLGFVTLALGLGMQWAGYGLPVGLEAEWSLALRMTGFVVGGVGVTLAILGRRAVGGLLFPLGFLAFLIPLPKPVIVAVEAALQAASAEVSEWLFVVAGTTHLRNGMVFELPGLVIRVAQECSGIRSTWVLFIVSCVGARLCLRTPWRRMVLVALVLPLGVLRNALRIWSISLLTVHVDAGVIDSVLHHKGGPLFFAASLLPFGAVLYWLMRGEVHARAYPKKP